MGQVPVRVKGSVKKGDYIIPYESGSGFGKAVSPEDLTIDMMSKIVGRAWSSVNTAGVNLVNTVIGIKSNEWIGFIKLNKEENDSLKKEMDLLKTQISKSNEILAQLVPGYKEAIEVKSSSITKSVSVEPSVKITEEAIKGMAITDSDLAMTREKALERFKKAAQILKTQGVDTDKNPFYSRLNSDPVYREKVITQIVNSYNKEK
jgi:hypothetical protein